MVIFLLIVIIAILLFGARAVRGVTGIALGIGAALIALGILVGLSRPYLGEEGAAWIILGSLAALVVWALVNGSAGNGIADGTQAVGGRDQMGLPVTAGSARDVWANFEPAMSDVLSDDDRVLVQGFLQSNDASGLRAFCNRVLRARFGDGEKLRNHMRQVQRRTRRAQNP